MREELKMMHLRTPRVDENDFDYMFDLARRFANSHMEASQAEVAVFAARGQDELIDDEIWYTHIDTLYLNDYLVWRFQGIFESLITTIFLPQSSQRLSGLQSRLREGLINSKFETLMSSNPQCSEGLPNEIGN